MFLLTILLSLIPAAVLPSPLPAGSDPYNPMPLRVATVGAGQYHKPHCTYAEQSLAKYGVTKRMNFYTKDAVLASGLTPCTVCHPDDFSDVPIPIPPPKPQKPMTIFDRNLLMFKACGTGANVHIPLPEGCKTLDFDGDGDVDMDDFGFYQRHLQPDGTLNVTTPMNLCVVRSVMGNGRSITAQFCGINPALVDAFFAMMQQFTNAPQTPTSAPTTQSIWDSWLNKNQPKQP